MWNEQEIENYLIHNLKPKRYEHSLSVRDTSIKLAKLYNEDIEKAKIAGLVHDCAKNMSDEKILDIAVKYNLQVDEIFKESPQLLHGAVAAVIAKEKMGIEDEDILNAVAYHTTGRENMSQLEKIIYLADYVEPLRDFPGVEELRKISYENLDKALLLSFNNTIKFVLEKGQLIHLDTIRGRNFIILQLKNK
ncbi:bis(5'-nucleosyl)-tetraphosphatase (symmetrical) YqeK [Clostridium scatologenes]|uniref:bis(5'-nucleosyl)-tetraphosphatase (symmetrical) n=1 Tax=Clostridium scatologenes TaxID=1548 RepID=A0A0E3GSI0_CLOSL|nr:bis(5'-nucleosyl)-tetraphosphatase (symmetrical) YqeK [Clostridium scatologenes]AKA72106.1 metal dependent phosphohydrolase [Clostridium scatologenes]